jgi:hypothetical protein
MEDLKKPPAASAASLDDEWMCFLAKTECAALSKARTAVAKSDCVKLAATPVADSVASDADAAPPSSEFYALKISTKTKILFLDRAIDIYEVFWRVPIAEYWRPVESAVKKQIRVVSKTPEEYRAYQTRLETVEFFSEHILKQIDNPGARSVKFKDERKVTIGISRKDIMNCRGKATDAFYNCFALILRIFHAGVYREIHVKVFNTGKLEIPGVVDDTLLESAKRMILAILRPLVAPELDYLADTPENNVLINSNFKCGYFIARDILHGILRSYDIDSVYDPCSYPGVKCKFYFNNEVGFDVERQTGGIAPEDRRVKVSEFSGLKKYTEVSFMIFRTGSCLILGNCTEAVLMFVYDFIRNLLVTEKAKICISSDVVPARKKTAKIRKRTMMGSAAYIAQMQ